MGAPASLRELEADVVLNDDNGWDRLQRNAREQWKELWDADEWFSSVPMTTEILRRRCQADGGQMRWRTGTEAWLTLRPVAGFDGPS